MFDKYISNTDYFVGGVNSYRLDLLMDIWNLFMNDKASIKDKFIRNFKDFESLSKYAKDQNERDLIAWVYLLNSHDKVADIPYEIALVKSVAVDNPELAFLSVSTAHKSKGLEFGIVELAHDFPSANAIAEPESDLRGNNYPNSWHYGPRNFLNLWNKNNFKWLIIFPEEELNLQYVALTRAEGILIANYFGDPPFDFLSKYIKKYRNFVLSDTDTFIPTVGRSRYAEWRPLTLRS